MKSGLWSGLFIFFAAVAIIYFVRHPKIQNIETDLVPAEAPKLQATTPNEKTPVESSQKRNNENKIAQVNDVQTTTAQLEETSGGHRVALNAHFSQTTMTPEEFAKIHPEIDKRSLDRIFKETREIQSIDSAFQGEPEIPLQNLTPSDCAILDSLTVPLKLRISGTGQVMDAISIIPDVPVPAEVYRCRFSRGGSSPFVTTVSPQSTE